MIVEYVDLPMEASDGEGIVRVFKYNPYGFKAVIEGQDKKGMNRHVLFLEGNSCPFNIKAQNIDHVMNLLFGKETENEQT